MFTCSKGYKFKNEVNAIFSVTESKHFVIIIYSKCLLQLTN